MHGFKTWLSLDEQQLLDEGFLDSLFRTLSKWRGLPRSKAEAMLRNWLAKKLGAEEFIYDNEPVQDTSPKLLEAYHQYLNELKNRGLILSRASEEALRYVVFSVLNSIPVDYDPIRIVITDIKNNPDISDDVKDNLKDPKILVKILGRVIDKNPRLWYNKEYGLKYPKGSEIKYNSDFLRQAKESEVVKRSQKFGDIEIDLNKFDNAVDILNHHLIKNNQQCTSHFAKLKDLSKWISRYYDIELGNTDELYAYDNSKVDCGQDYTAVDVVNRELRADGQSFAFPKKELIARAKWTASEYGLSLGDLDDLYSADHPLATSHTLGQAPRLGLD